MVDADSARTDRTRSTKRPGTTTRDEIDAMIELAAIDAGSDLRQPADLRAALRGRISADTLGAYDLACRSGRRPVVLGAIGGVCRGCHLRLPAAVAIRFRSARRLMACPHCLRLLYDPGWLESR